MELFTVAVTVPWIGVALGCGLGYLLVRQNARITERLEKLEQDLDALQDELDEWTGEAPGPAGPGAGTPPGGGLEADGRGTPAGPEPAAAAPETGAPPARRAFSVPLRGLPREGIGVGDLVKRVTDVLRIKPCRGCERRRQAWNRWVIKGSGDAPPEA